MKIWRKTFTGILIAVIFISPQTASANNLEVAGWIPYWQDNLGIESADDNLRNLDRIHPFIYEVNASGEIVDRANLDERQWRNLFRDARRRRVDLIPTIAWFDGDAIHQMLSDPDQREQHIEDIVELVDDNNFDGIDIDYENKLAITIDYFSDFLEELKDELGRDTLTCTVEARTPPASRFRTVPDVLQYANDYQAMNEHCDIIELMAYDQQRIDWQLNDNKSGAPYIPVADADWVKKVIELALEDFDEDKVVLGIPTYGRVWRVTVAPNWFREYDSISSLNPPRALELAEMHDVKIGRNQAGEASFSYFPEDSIYKILNSLPTPEGTPAGGEAAAKALLFANFTGLEVPVNVVWYSDAEAVEDKIELAEKHNLRGVSLFKIDGEEDPDIWDLF